MDWECSVFIALLISMNIHCLLCHTSCKIFNTFSLVLVDNVDSGLCNTRVRYVHSLRYCPLTHDPPCVKYFLTWTLFLEKTWLQPRMEEGWCRISLYGMKDFYPGWNLSRTSIMRSLLWTLTSPKRSQKLTFVHITINVFAAIKFFLRLKKRLVHYMTTKC